MKWNKARLHGSNFIFKGTQNCADVVAHDWVFRAYAIPIVLSDTSELSWALKFMSKKHPTNCFQPDTFPFQAWFIAVTPGYKSQIVTDGYSSPLALTPLFPA